MGKEKSILIILSVIFTLAIVIQVVRSNSIVTLWKNENGAMKNKEIQQILIPEDIKENKEVFMIVYDSVQSESKDLKNNIEKTLSYMKKQYNSIDAGLLTEIDAKYKTVIIAMEDLQQITNMEKLIKYVENGGKVFFVQRPIINSAFYKIYRKLGIYEIGYMMSSKGIQLLENVLIQNKGIKIEEDIFENASIALRLEQKSNLYAKSMEEIPLLWDVSYGKGKFMVFNGTALLSKVNRGLIVGGLSLLNEDFIYPVMNIKSFFIDDFPAPLPRGINNEIYQQYGRDVPDFFREVWWPEIIRGSVQYDIKYTGVLIQSYNDWILPSFTDPDSLEVGNLIMYGRELLMNRGELGLHGYNHQSLTFDKNKLTNVGYNSWKNESNMVEALKEVNGFFKKGFPNYELKNYVPPSNILGKEGREALKKEIPSIGSISSLYLEDGTNVSYVQEFEKASDGIIEFPRFTSGYQFDNTKEWITANGVTSIGIVSHFIHPDDLLDPYRSGEMSWSQLAKEYETYLKMIKEKYSWLESMTATEGVKTVENYVESEVYFQYKENYVRGYCEKFLNDMYFIIRTEKKPVNSTGCFVTSIDKNIYLIQATAPVFTIELGR